MEIGSIYEINPASVTDGEADGKAELTLKEVEKYGKKYKVFTASGREAIALALKNLEENEPHRAKRCLLPAYMCDTVFFPFERAGWEIHFYHIEKDLEVQTEGLCRLIDEKRPGLLFIHSYYGVDTWKSMRSLLKEWRAKGICIMEDVTQSYYLESAGKEADYVVGSLRKWYPIPDGGFVASDHPVTAKGLTEHREFTEKRLHLLFEKWEYLHGMKKTEEKKALKADYLQRNREMEEWLDDYRGIGILSKEAETILKTVDEEEAGKRRNANRSFLATRLRGKKQFVPILSEGEAPLYFAIYAREREELQQFLREHDIYAPVLWPIGRENEKILTETERYIYDHMLALPIDQRYGRKEMERLAEVMEAYENKKETETEVIGIRADANELIASGHIMRCITIAKQLKKLGKKVLFFTADGYAKEMLAQAAMEYVCLNSAWNRMEEETALLRKLLQENHCTKLLVDSYQATVPYFEALKDSCKIIYMDDCFEAVYPVDMVINYNAYHVRFPYEESYGKNTRLLLGTGYVPLREEFAQNPGQKQQEKKEASHVLLSAGGGDTYQALLGILSETAGRKEWEQVIFHTVVGRFHKNTEALYELSERHKNIQLHCNVSHMAELMGQCDVAVSAAGTVLFELCAMQVPTVFFVCADNQQYDSEFFAKEERMLFAGDIRTDRKQCLKEICRQLQLLIEDGEMRSRMKKKLREVTDGQGAVRIAKAITEL